MTDLHARNRRFARASTASRDMPSRHVRLSILMPAYNEERTIARAVKAVLDTTFPCAVELIVVDDGSEDATVQILDLIEDRRMKVHRHAINRGKGAALKTAAAMATGTHIVPFDADMEYAPRDLVAMLEPIIADRCDVVYGTRLFGVNTVYQSYTHAMGNRGLTLAANLLFNSYMRDLHTCLKMVPLELFRNLELAESGFGLDTEITAKLLKLGMRPFEVPVSYHSRSVAAGKKITWHDGVECLRVLTRVRFKPSEEEVAWPLERVDESVPVTTPEDAVDALTVPLRDKPSIAA